jgi:signal transduction histidine kinase
MASAIQQPIGAPRNNLSASQETLRIAGESFAHGIGCHAPCDMRFPLDGKYRRFLSMVGVDDTGSGSVTFEVHADGKKLFDSGPMLSGQPSRVIDLDLTGKKELRLVVTDAGDGSNFDFADWAEASITPASGINGVLGMHLSSPLSDWVASPMMSQVGQFSARTMDRAFDPLDVREAGGLYDSQGRGLFFGPVGRPVSYLDGRVSNSGNQHATLDLHCEMSSVRVDPGQVRWGQQAVLLVERPEIAQARWISWVAESHEARQARTPMSGWLSWYWLGNQVSEVNLQEVVDFAGKPGGPLRPQVIQIDDGYQRQAGQTGMNEKFPAGMRGVASQIASSGAMPGLMVRLENYDPGGIHQFLENVRHAVTNGFRYLKIAEFGDIADPDEKQTQFERKRAMYQSIRQVAGEEVYLMAAGNGIDRASVGAVDACRVSGSTERHRISSGMDSSVLSLPFNRHWFTVDTDCYYLATDIAKLPPVLGGWPVVRTWLSMTGLSCGNAMTSDPWHWQSMAPFLRNTEILSPPASESARAIDLGTSAGLHRVVGHLRRPWGHWTVALLWNAGTQAKEITLDFAAAGMEPNKRYAVWSFWDNRFLGIAEKSWTSPVLEPYASQHLCFTPLDRDPLKPTIIGSNLHIWCGAAELQQVTSLHGAMELHFTDAGARSGDLFLHCAERPEIRTAQGCKVVAIDSTGRDIWRVSIADRQRGMMQSLEFDVDQPATHQPWFWVLMVLFITSLAFVAWRYLENLRARQEILRLQQKNALEEERGRIARDLHDELGANLARIGLLTGLAEQAIGDDHKTRHQLERILGATRGISRQLDSIVWAVDPANDSLESLARYLHGHAEDYLSMAGIRCRFIGMDLPHIPLSSSLRHHLLMITKEVLHNVVKHSGASTVTLHLRHLDGALFLEIEDDGKGIGAPEGHRHGNGLNNIRKRTLAVGGSCDFLTGSGGRGTLVRLCIPVHHQNVSPPS